VSAFNGEPSDSPVPSPKIAPKSPQKTIAEMIKASAKGKNKESSNELPKKGSQWNNITVFYESFTKKG